MSDHILVCHGGYIQRIYIPPFKLVRGESLCIEWPVSPDHPSYHDFKNLLLQPEENSFMQVLCPIRICKNFRFIAKLLGSEFILYMVTIFAPWLIASKLAKSWISYYEIQSGQATRLDKSRMTDIKIVLNREGILPDTLEGNERKLLSFVECAKDSDVIVFDTVGCTSSIYSMLEPYARNKSTIEIRFPISGNIRYPDFNSASLVKALVV